MEKKEFKPQHHYRFERNTDETLKICEAVKTPQGWLENKENVMSLEEAEAFRRLLKERGYVVTFPPSYAGPAVLEWWDHP